ERHHQRAIGQVTPDGDFLDAVQNNGTLRGQDKLLAVGVELPATKAGASADSAKRIREPVRQFRHVVEAHNPAVSCRQDEVAFLPRERPEVRFVRVHQPTEEARKRTLCAPLLAVYRQDGKWAIWAQGGDQPADCQTPTVIVNGQKLAETVE